MVSRLLLIFSNCQQQFSLQALQQLAFFSLDSYCRHYPGRWDGWPTTVGKLDVKDDLAVSTCEGFPRCIGHFLFRDCLTPPDVF
jgi:hypothetical protein